MKNHGLGKWASLDSCEVYTDSVKNPVCGRAVTHVVLLNGPDDVPYVAGTCAKHRGVEGGTTIVMTLKKFFRIVEDLRKQKIEEVDLPWAFYEAVEEVRE